MIDRNDLSVYFETSFRDCFEAANYLRAMHGLRLVNIDISLTSFISDQNLMCWYLQNIDSEWENMAITVINRHIATLVTVNSEKMLLGVTRRANKLIGAKYDKIRLHYPLYEVRNISMYSDSKLKQQYAVQNTKEKIANES